MKKWRCTVCDYIHEGDKPPEVCPVCGVGPEMFEEVADEPQKDEQTEAKKWRCTVCNYIHKGAAPPDECPVCGVGPELFEEVTEEETIELMTEEEMKQAKPAIHKFSYGLFVIGSKNKEKVNAQTANTAFQITSDPAKIAIGINKNNLTWECINESNVFTVNFLSQDQIESVKHFGFQSGRKVDKFKDIQFITKKTGAPILTECLGYLECRVEHKLDSGTHTIFVGQVIGGESLGNDEPLTYAYYRAHK